MREQLLYYAIIYGGEWHRVKKAIETKEAWERISYQGKYLTILDEAYPPKLHLLKYPPWVIFYEGNISLLDQLAVALVGSRDESTYGRDMCRHIVKNLKERYVIVSGMAKGIDAIAHQEAIDKQTIGIIGCGLDIIYPRENQALYQEMKARQLLLSEYPNGTKPLAHHFPWRNRLLAALSSAVVVVQARKRSGTMLTVNEALDIDIPIYCVPYMFHDPCGEGCNLLIAQGAQILIDDYDISSI